MCPALARDVHLSLWGCSTVSHCVQSEIDQHLCVKALSPGSSKKHTLLINSLQIFSKVDKQKKSVFKSSLEDGGNHEDEDGWKVAPHRRLITQSL